MNARAFALHTQYIHVVEKFYISLPAIIKCLFFQHHQFTEDKQKKWFSIYVLPYLFISDCQCHAKNNYFFPLLYSRAPFCAHTQNQMLNTFDFTPGINNNNNKFSFTNKSLFKHLTNKLARYTYKKYLNNTIFLLFYLQKCLKFIQSSYASFRSTRNDTKSSQKKKTNQKNSVCSFVVYF